MIILHLNFLYYAKAFIPNIGIGTNIYTGINLSLLIITKKHTLQKYKDFLRLIVTMVKKKDVFHHASAITFNLFICAIPFVLIMISIIGYLLSYEDAFKEIVRYGQELFPSFTYESRSGDVFQGAITLETFLRPLIGARRVFGLVGLVVLIVFSQGLFHTIKHVVFDIFDIEDRKHPLLELIYNFFTFGLMGSVFIAFSFAISFLSLFSLSEFNVPFTDVVIQLSWVYEFLNIIIPVCFTLFLFYILFRYISEKRMPRRVAMVGAIVYTLLFEVAKFGLGTYLQYAFAAYRYFYQGYTILVIIGIWAFYSAALLVVSVIAAKAYQEKFVRPEPVKENPYTAIS